MEYLPHIGYAVVAISFAVRDVFWLRALAIVAGIFLIATSIHQHLPAMLFWNSLFVCINLARLAMMVYGEHAAHFSEDEKTLHETLFSGFTKLEFMKLLKVGQWRTAQAGATLTHAGQPVTDVMLIYHGLAHAQVDGNTVAQLRDGQLVGEMSYITGDPATATVTVAEPTRYLAFPKDNLRHLLQRNPSMRFALSSVVSADLTRKLARPKSK